MSSEGVFYVGAEGGGGGACLLVTVFLMVPPGESTDISLVSVANSSQDIKVTLHLT
jgi:hypothetical protein